MPELDAAEANRRFYARVAETYDATEECVVDPRRQAYLHALLDRALAELGPEPRALDACGGSGNVTLALAERGVGTLAVDVSPEMLALLARKAAARGLPAETRVAEIEPFLREPGPSFDVIVFSSALHHLEDPGAVLALAAARLEPGGVLLTVFDPTQTGRAGRVLRRVDYGLHVARHTPGRLLQRARGRDQLGAAAERHALAGLDDAALRARLEAAGLEVLVHDRRADARFALVRAAQRLLREPSGFALLARRPG
jgi:ubiquinone/menaquinone biosynthesis C-methylase UbiE